MCLLCGIEITERRNCRFITRNMTHLPSVVSCLTHYEIEFIADWKTVDFVNLLKPTGYVMHKQV